MKQGIVVFIGNIFEKNAKRVDNKKDRIADAVGKYYGVNLSEDTRRREIVFPRQVAMLLLVQMTDIGLVNIGKMFNRHYTSVIFGARTATNLCDSNPEIKKQVEEIKSMI